MFTTLLAHRNTAPCRTSLQQATFSSVKPLSLISALLLGVGAACLSNPAYADSPRWAEGRILVQTRAGLSDSDLNVVLQEHKGRVIKRIRQIDLYVVEVPAQAEEAIARALSHHPHIKSAEPDRLMELSAVPNDTYYSYSWHLPKIQAPTAWDSTWGNNVTIAVLDTGIEATHPDLNGKLAPGWNTVDNNTNTTDGNGHGTQVAGVAAATTNNSMGVAGVAGGASIMPIRVSTMADGSAYASDIAEGLTWAADHGAAVANVSYDGLTTSTAINSVAQYMISKGVVVVVAAGNSGSDPGYVDSPAMITVSATTSSDAIASWSSYGQYVDVAAPGVGIWTTKLGGSYGSSSGTSFASPIVAGVLALMKAVDPTLAPTTAEQILESTADDLGAAGWDPYYGYGRVNAAAAVAAVRQQTPDTQPPTVTVTAPTNGAKVAGLVPVNVTATDNIGVVRVDLYANGALVASDSTTPYQFSWDSKSAADGPVTLTAKAFDFAGNQGISSATTVTVDNTPPSVSINSPANGSNVSKLQTVTIAISGSDNTGIAQLSCYVDNSLLQPPASCSGTNCSMNCSWNSRKAAAGAHTIKAVAQDTAGNTTSTSIQVYK